MITTSSGESEPRESVRANGGGSFPSSTRLDDQPSIRVSHQAMPVTPRRTAKDGVFAPSFAPMFARSGRVSARMSSRHSVALNNSMKLGTLCTPSACAGDTVGNLPLRDRPGGRQLKTP